MDKKYIAMFAEAKEIQRLWKPEVGDRYAYTEYRDCDEWTSREWEKTEKPIIQVVGECANGRYFNSYDPSLDGEGNLEKHQYFSENYQGTRSYKAIFLPSIEQMAEMWHEAQKKIGGDTRGTGFALALYDFLKGNYTKKWFNGNWPLPIIVLAFIMHDLFSMSWGTEKEGWVKPCQ